VRNWSAVWASRVGVGVQVTQGGDRPLRVADVQAELAGVRVAIADLHEVSVPAGEELVEQAVWTARIDDLHERVAQPRMVDVSAPDALALVDDVHAAALRQDERPRACPEHRSVGSVADDQFGRRLARRLR
jgi:hypothetical protein